MRHHPGLPAQADQHLRFGEAGVGEAQVTVGDKQREQPGLAQHDQHAADDDTAQRIEVMTTEKNASHNKNQCQRVRRGRQSEAFQQKDVEWRYGSIVDSPWERKLTGGVLRYRPDATLVACRTNDHSILEQKKNGVKAMAYIDAVVWCLTRHLCTALLGCGSKASVGARLAPTGG
nr:hypothetical protein GCM10020185_51690 [Pseudomonas brassicacearum subsp. brassicacearum]